jgi:hypothetical protein
VVIDINEKETDPRIKAAAIGHDARSTTQFPNHFKTTLTDNEVVEVVNIYDCPGFQDSNKFENLISNCYYVYNTFINIPKNKFVLVIQETALDAGLAADFK